MLPVVMTPVLAWAAPPSTVPPARPLPAATTVVPSTVPAIGRWTSPGGGRVAAGSGTINQHGSVTTIDQRSQKLSLNWRSFDIGADSTVNFLQPDAQAIAVNRIADPNGSVILGRLNANGQVFLINPNGVLFGPGAQVNVGGLVASTLDLVDSDVGTGTLHFRGDSRGRVLNRGTITAAHGGYVALLGAQVVNDGTLMASGGSVAMGGGSAVTLSLDGNRLLDLQVNRSALDALADNHQLIVADGGQVLMSAGAKDALLASTVNNSGVIQARTVENRAGRIVLLGGMEAGTTSVAGTLDASAPAGGNGGFIETSAARVKVADDTRITTLAARGDNGTWLIDPQDFTIAASGGDMTGAVLSAQLGSGDVTIESASGATSGQGDIFVNDAVGWNANTLTLTAAQSIDINAVMTAGGSAGLALNPSTANGSDAAVSRGSVNIMPGLGRVDFTGSGNSLQVNGTPYTFITNLAELQGISGDLAGHYALRNNIDASATAGWNPDGGGFAGFAPLGDPYAGAFDGVFDGLGHTIKGLVINRPGTDYVGLFGYVGNDGSIRNVGLDGGSTRGGNNTGALVGYGRQGPISHAYATGKVYGADNVGGLIGASGGALLEYLYATGDVEGSGNAGGLVGYARNGRLRYSYASGDVRGRNAGGVGGAFESYSLWYSYATGDVSGTLSAGGLVGEWSHGTLWYSYASSQVTGTASTGGLIGDSSYTDTIDNYWDMDSTGQAQACGGASEECSSIVGREPQGLSTAQAFQQAQYAALNFTDHWYMVDGKTRPFLRFEYATTISNAHQLQLVNMDLSGNYALASDIDASMTSGARASDMWSNTGFVSIGNVTTKFAGIFDGLGHRISNLSIRPAGSPSSIGLFGATATAAEVRNIGLDDVLLTGANGQVGALVGSNEGTIVNSYATGTVIGATHVGGLVGDNLGTIDGSYFSGSVVAGNRLGGLVGVNTGSISNSYSTGQVASSAFQDLIGGLVGNNSGTVSVSYASATVINGNTDPNRHTGSLVGYNSGNVDKSYWNLGLSALPGIDGGTVAGASGLSATDMMKQSSFVGWDLANTGGSNAIWRIYEGDTTPLLRSFMTHLAVTSNVTATYNGAAFAGSTDYTFSALTPSQWLRSNEVDSSLLFGSARTSAPAINAGSYTLSGGVYSGQMGYDIDYTAGTLTIDPAALTVSSSDVAKTYDGGLSAAGTAVVTGGTLFGDDALNGGNFAFTDKNAGAHKAVSVSGVTIDDGNGGGNYIVTYADNTTSTIVAKDIASVAGIRADSKIYDGSAAATLDLSGASFSGLISGDRLTVASAAGRFGDKNAASGKTVSIDAITLGGSDAGNYRLIDDTASATADITRRPINVSTTASDKVYDGTTKASLSVSSDDVLAGDTVEFAGTGSFADKNVGTGKTVSIDDLTATGVDAGNYVYLIHPASTADITPATLIYRADPVTVPSGGSWGLLGGTVSGLVGGDTLADATDGTLTWQTPATAASPAGIYAVDGGGLSARNYVFAQAPGNATALRLTGSALGPAIIPALVERTVAGLRPTDESGEAPAPYAPDVRIVDGGVHLP